MKTFEESLVHFLDGQSAPIDEEELMAQMAVSPEKRELLRSHLNMRDAIARDVATLRPPRPLRDGTVALMLATAAAYTGTSGGTAPAKPGRGSGIIGKSAILGGGAIIGALVTMALMTARTDAPVHSASVTAPAEPSHTTVMQQAAPAPATTGSQEVRVVHDKVVVPETVYVAAPPVFVHDTTIVQAPAPRMVPVAPTVTIQRETVYVAPKAGLK